MKANDAVSTHYGELRVNQEKQRKAILSWMALTALALIAAFWVMLAGLPGSGIILVMAILGGIIAAFSAGGIYRLGSLGLGFILAGVLVDVFLNLDQLGELIVLAGYGPWAYLASQIKPRRWTWSIGITGLIFTIATVMFVVLGVNEYGHLSVWALIFPFGSLLVLLILLPSLERSLTGHGYQGRLLLALAFVLNWLAAGLGLVDALLLKQSMFPQFMVIYTLSNLLMGVGVLAEARYWHLGIWPFILAIGGLQLSWLAGVLSLHGLNVGQEAQSTFFVLWVLAGTAVGFLCTIVLVRALDQRSLQTEGRLQRWLKLLDNISRISIQEPNPAQTLQKMFDQLKDFDDRIVGLRIVDRGNRCIGDVPDLSMQNDASQEVHRMPLMSLPLRDQEGPVGTLFIRRDESDGPRSWEVLLPLLGARLRFLVHQHDLISKAMTDQLTGLYNRHGFHQLLPGFLSRAQHAGMKICVLIIDVDHFKRINDAYGHRAGDEVLRRLAEILIRCFRDEDLKVRWGGEEFMVLLFGADLRSASLAGERLRRMVENERIDLVGWSITVSIGIAGGKVPLQIKTIYTWQWRADRCLYQAKEQGRNRICCEDPFEGGTVDSLESF